MNIIKRILIGDVVSGSEAAFLKVVDSSFPDLDALIFVNFQVGCEQIDFFVVAPAHAGLIELKHFAGPVFGGINGAWELLDAAGNRVPYQSASNPYKQVLRQTYALSDAMKAYRRIAAVPDADGGCYYRNFRAYVAIAPTIASGSFVTSGDNKARVKGADDVVDCIRTTGHASTWAASDWYRFAVEKLRLRPVTLDEAIDPRSLEASSAVKMYCERMKSLVGTNLPPQIGPATPDQLYGAALVARLSGAENVLLTGPTGSAKTFHLHHAVLAMLDGVDELPILVKAKRYQGGDFWPFLRSCLAPAFSGDPKSLLAASMITGLRPTLLVDALNECASAQLEELLKGVVAFALQYDARTVLTAQESLTIAGLTVEELKLALPDASQKREIYAYHAGVKAIGELDEFCGGFRNAYELTIAGRCHGYGRYPSLAVELYDRYIAKCLPARNAIVAGALARHLAKAMGDQGSLHLGRNDCEVVASRFLAEQGAPLTVLEDLMHSGLLDATGDVVSFEHELLIRHLRSSALQRGSASLAELCAALRLPRNRELLEFVLQRVASREDVVALLEICDDVEVLVKGYDGQLGPLVRDAIVEECDWYARRAIAEIETLDLHIDTTPTDSGRVLLVGLELRGLTDLRPIEKLIADLISRQDADPTGRARLLAIIDRSEAILGNKISRLEQAGGNRRKFAWSELLQPSFLSRASSGEPRGFRVLSYVKQRIEGNAGRPLDPNLRAALTSRALAESGREVALHLLLGDSCVRREDGDTLVNLVELAWDTGVHALQMGALFALQIGRTAVDGAGPSAQKCVADFLARVEASNWVLSSMLVEVQAQYGAIEPLVSVEEALCNMRITIGDDELSRALFEVEDRNQAAYYALSLIFEDVYQGAYYDAYHWLSEDERLRILSLAAQAPSLGFTGSWIMHELRTLDRLEALPVFRSAASQIDLSSPFPQDAVAVFVTAIYGFSKYAELPPTREEPTSGIERAWFAIGDALFWAFHEGGRCSKNQGARIFASFDDDMLLDSAAVLSQLRSSYWQMAMGDMSMATFPSVYPDQTRKIAKIGLNRRDEIRMRHRSFVLDSVPIFLVKILGEIGIPSDVPSLRAVMDDALIGEAAIKSIQDIEARSLASTSEVKPRRLTPLQ